MEYLRIVAAIMVNMNLVGWMMDSLKDVSSWKRNPSTPVNMSDWLARNDVVIVDLDSSMNNLDLQNLWILTINWQLDDCIWKCITLLFFVKKNDFLTTICRRCWWIIRAVWRIVRNRSRRLIIWTWWRISWRCTWRIIAIRWHRWIAWWPWWTDMWRRPSRR